MKKNIFTCETNFAGKNYDVCAMALTPYSSGYFYEMPQSGRWRLYVVEEN